MKLNILIRIFKKIEDFYKFLLIVIFLIDSNRKGHQIQGYQGGIVN